MRPPGNSPEKNVPVLFLISEQTTRIAKHSNAKQQCPPRTRPATSTSGSLSLLRLRPDIHPPSCEHHVKTISSAVNHWFLLPPRKRLSFSFTVEHRDHWLKTTVGHTAYARVKTKHCSGLTCGAKVPDGAAFSPLAVPTQGVLYGCLTSDPKTRLASRQACLPCFPGQALQFCHGLPHGGIIAVDDASFSGATRLFYADTCSGRQLLL